MHELQRLLHALQTASARGESVVLTTVLSVQGSVYRGAGARMLVLEAGDTVGAVSGGCLEADIVARAPALTESGRAEVVRYDTRTSDDGVLGLGMGCEGIIELLLEPLSAQALTATINLFELLRSRRRPTTIATLTYNLNADEAPGARALLDEEGSFFAGDAEVLQRAGDLTLEVVRPVISLVVCGGGADAVPVTKLAHAMGWHVTVVDHRPSFANAGRFPDADAIVCMNLPERPGALADEAALDERTMAVVMAHSALHDGAYLHALLDAGASYIGVLGPRRRPMQLLGGRAATGIPETVHSPVGLDLGAETPDEIALAIVAEIAAVHAGRAGGMLCHRPGPIHTNRG